MFKKLINSIFESSNERLRNPFISSFIFTALILNWKTILVIVFSDLNMIERINYVSINYNNVYDCLVLPLFFALFYVIVLPYLMQFFSYAVKKAKNNQIKGFYEEETFKLSQRANLVRGQVELERIKADSKELTDLNEQIESLKKSNSEKDELLKELRNKFQDLQLDYQSEMNKSLDDTPNGISDYEFRHLTNDSKLFNKFLALADSNINNNEYVVNNDVLEKDAAYKYFIDTNLIRFISQGKGNSKIFLTNKGRIFLTRIKDKYISTKSSNRNKN